MRTTTKSYKDLISLCLCICIPMLIFASATNNNPNVNSKNTPLSEDPAGNVSISMVTVGSFPEYGTNIPFNITVENQGSADVYDIEVTNTIPDGYTFDPTGTDWMPTAAPNVYTNTIAGPIGNGGSELITINLVPIAAADSTDWINVAEITEFRDAPGGTICADSDASDNIDMTAVQIFDLALRKELFTTGDLCFGQSLIFRTYIMNQGNTPATEIEVIDFIPEGYTFDPTTTLNTNNGWSGAVNPIAILPGQLNSNEETYVEIELTLEMEMFDEMAWNNYTTINAANDDTGAERGSFDADSEIGTNSAIENMVLPGSADDNNMNGGGLNAGEDEDDHDPAAPLLYDLALEKVQVTALPSFSYDEQVVFRNNIYNQGNQTVTNIEIVDYIPCGLEFDSADNPGWSYNTATRIAHYEMTSVLAPADDDFVEIILTVVQCYENQETAWTNFSEIAAATDMLGDPFNDVDSVMDSIMNNDGVVVPSQLDGGGPKANEDEDDHDLKMIEVVDLALRKRILEPGPFNFGDTITFVNTVYNQGNIVLDSIQIRDYMPAGYTFPADINPTWTLNAFGNPEGLIPTMLFPEDTINYELNLILTPANDETDYYNYSEIFLVQDTTNSFFKNRFDDADSFVGSHFFGGSTEPNVLPDGPDDDEIFEDGFAGGDSDDNDVAAPIFYDLALSKNLANPNAVIDYGMPIEYIITVTNEGTMVANNITVTDYLPCGLSVDMTANPGWLLDPASGYITYLISGPITPGASVDISLNLSIQECANTDAGSFTNEAEISVDDGDDRDSTPDDTPGDDPDEDDIDSQPIKVYDLSLTKVIGGTATTFSMGDPITFTIEVTNEGGDTVQNVKVVDYITCGYAFDPNNNSGWSLNATTGFLEFNNMAMLPPGESFSTDLNLTLQPCQVADEDNYLNGAEISSAEDTDAMIVDDIDSTPDETQGNELPNEDDYDEVGVDIFDLNLDKSLTTPLGDLSYGQVISYDITVANEGTMIASGIEVTDYIPCGLTYDATNNTIPWVVDATTGYASYTIPSDIAPGESFTVTILLTLEECTASGSDKFNNKAEISVDNEDDDDSTPDDDPDNDLPGEDDNDDEPLLVYDLSLTKEVANAQSYSIGDQITFFITLTNEGGESVKNVKIVDYLPCGYSFVPHFGWSMNGSGQIENTYSNVLVPGESVVISLQLTIVACSQAAPDNYLNGAEIAEMQDLNDIPVDDVDSTPDQIQGNEEDDEDDYDEAQIDIFDLNLDKSLTTMVTDFSYGQLVSYDITVMNEGSAVASGIEVTDYIPCGLVYDAANNAIPWIIDASTGYASYTIPSDIAPGESETVTIVLTLESCTDDDANKYNNKAEISVDNGDDDDSNPDDDPENDTPGEDDNDEEPLPIYDLSLMKNVVGSSFSVGDMITFDITVTNEGSESVQNVKVVDYLPCGFSFVPNNGWTLNATSGLIENTYIDELALGESFTLSLDLTIINCNQGGADNYLNGAEIAAMEDVNGEPISDSDSTPDETQGNENPNEDDYDEARIDIYDLSLSKVRTSLNNPLTYGSSITYDITVTNEGSLPATNVEVTDYIPCGLLYDSVNNAQGWSVNSSGYAVNTITQTILPGNSETVSITLVIEQCTTPTYASYNNLAEISEDDGDDDDSNPDDNPENDTEDEDDNDDEPIDVYDLAIDKSVIEDPNDLTIGDIISFEMVVTNEGNRLAQDINIIDYVPCGLSTAGQANAGWSPISGSNNITYNIAQLAPGESVTIPVTFLLVSCTTPSTDDYNNETEITDFDDENGEEGDDIDSTPDDIPGDPAEEDDNDLVEIELAGNLGGDVWKDLDFDGIHDTNEPAIEGMTVNLFDCDGNFIRSTTTGATGFYVFVRLPANDYQIQFDLSSIDEPCIFTDPDVGGNDEIDSDAGDNGFAPCTTVEPGMDNYSIDAGLIENLGSIGDFVFMDLDADGIQDFGENGIEGVTVYLYTEGGLAIDSTVTDNQGAYRFNDVSTGSYYIGFGVMDDYLPTLADQGNNDENDSDVTGNNGPNTTDVFVLAPGENSTDIDGGFYQCATICGYTWLDLVVENDLRDLAENGINGMKVTVFKVENGVASAYDHMHTGINPDTPSDDGYFNFCVPPGRYYLEFTLPPLGLVQVLPLSGPQDINSDVTNVNGIGTTSAFTMTNGGEKCDIGAGYTLMSQVGNAVWFDENHNGQREVTEAPIEGVVVQAYDLNNVMVAEAITDENGLYNIDYLQKKEYYLKFTPDNGMAFTQALVGGDDEMDSDVDHSYGPNTTRAFLGDPGSQNKNMDAGLVMAVLPVEWGSIKAENKGNYNLVSWSTLTEVNNDLFLVQRAADVNGVYTTIGNIKAEELNSTAIKSYTFEDYDLAWSQYYYRIVQVDIDGRQSFSEVVAVTISRNDFLLYPNPTDREIRISNTSFKDLDQITVMIHDQAGKLAHEENIQLNGSIEIQVSVKHLPTGMYSIDLIDNGISLFKERFIRK